MQLFVVVAVVAVAAVVVVVVVIVVVVVAVVFYCCWRGCDGIAIVAFAVVTVAACCCWDFPCCFWLLSILLVFGDVAVNVVNAVGAFVSTMAAVHKPVGSNSCVTIVTPNWFWAP